MTTVASLDLAAEDTNLILKSILEELKGIKGQLARQDQLIEDLRKHGTSMDTRLKTNSAGPETLNVIKSNQPPSMTIRIGPMLQEALKRYQSDSVPFWSTLYGANLASEETRGDVEAFIRADEWTSITGIIWKIPNDNRVSFCFLAPWSDPQTLVQVRNFLFHFHKSERNGENFNVWDWFDTGISSYWFPGKTTSSMPHAAKPVLETGAKSTNLRTSNELSHLIAPWRRIINLKGLTTIENCDSVMSRKLTDSDLCPFLITNSENSIFQRPVDNMIEQAIRCHLRCLRVSSTYHDELKTKDCALFHITFYEIIQRNSTSKVTELWPSGDLYGDKQQHPKGSRQIREAALTIVAVPCREMSGSKARAIFWTMICLRPSQFPHLYYSEQGDEVARRRTNEMIDDMGDLVHNSLVTVLSRWNEIARYFDELLTEKRDLLRPDYHDSLLTDDDNFSRSKKYFWAIEFLKEACNSISDNIQQIKHFLEFLESNPPGTKKAENEFFLKLKRHYLTIQKLETLETRLKLKKEEAAALRDGLFSASAVMDSRASYQLGQNVKLLTLVSIFFLPLSFCASIWSVNNSIFSMTAFAIVTPILGIMTYVVAFNLENIASCFKRPRKPSSVHRPSRPQRSEKKGTSESTWKSEEDIHSRPEYSGKQPLWTRRNLPIWPRELIWKLLTLVGGLMPPRRKKRRRLEEEFQPTSLADLRDVHVKVEVNVEESGAT